MFDKKIQHDEFVHFVEYTIVKVSQQSNMYRTVDMKIRVISTLLNLVFSSEYTCIWYDVYRNRKIGINFREMVSEETAVYSIDQM